MKKLLSVLLTILVVGLTCNPVCTHVHTEECGLDGVNCTHECNPIEPYGRIELPDE